MIGRWVRRIVGFIIVFPILVAILGTIVLRLWNWLMPAIFGLHIITFWQALGLMLLSWILFRGGGFLRPGHHGFKGRGRWRHMSPEDREKFRQAMRERWGHFSARPPESAK